MTIQAIETRYAGCRFRSRLEARWAVFFDALGMGWEYEPQGFQIGPAHDRRHYLPDFWLPGERMWVEVKGDRGAADLQKLAYAADANFGLPGTQEQRIILLGNVPRVDRGWFAWHHALTFDKGELFQVLFRFGTGGVDWMHHPPGLLLGCDADHYAELNTGPSFWQFDAFTQAGEGRAAGRSPIAPAPAAVVNAYAAARSARFEHGERGR